MIKPQFSQFVLSVHCMLGIELGNMHRAYYPPSRIHRLALEPDEQMPCRLFW